MGDILGNSQGVQAHNSPHRIKKYQVMEKRWKKKMTSYRQKINKLHLLKLNKSLQIKCLKFIQFFHPNKWDMDVTLRAKIQVTRLTYAPNKSKKRNLSTCRNLSLSINVIFAICLKSLLYL